MSWSVWDEKFIPNEVEGSPSIGSKCRMVFILYFNIKWVEAFGTRSLSRTKLRGSPSIGSKCRMVFILYFNIKWVEAFRARSLSRTKLRGVPLSAQSTEWCSFYTLILNELKRLGREVYPERSWGESLNRLYDQIIWGDTQAANEGRL